MNPLSFVLGLSVTDLERSIDWYRRIFGLGRPAIEPVEGIVEFPYGPIWLQLVQSDSRPAGATTVANFQVADVQAERERLVALGVEVGVVMRVPGAVDYVEFADPDGNPFVLHSLRVTTASCVWPTLKASDARALIDFLVKQFGFVETAAFGEGGRIVHAQLDWPEGGGIMLGDAGPDNVWTLAPGSAGVYLVTERVGELYDAAVACGVEVVMELTAHGEGQREFAVRDPEGNLWSFGTYRGEAP